MIIFWSYHLSPRDEHLLPFAHCFLLTGADSNAEWQGGWALERGWEGQMVCTERENAQLLSISALLVPVPWESVWEGQAGVAGKGSPLLSPGLWS